MPMATYDEVYSRPELYWGDQPNRLAERVTALFSPQAARGKLVIDLGCGEGRDLIHFAQHGLQVIGVDVSAPGLAKAQRWAAQAGLTIETVQSSLQAFRLQEPCDVLYSSGTLTYLPPELRQQTFAHWKECTRPGGVHAFNAFVEKPYIETAPDWGVDEYVYRSGELLLHYWDWELLAFEEFAFDCNSSGVPHRHAMDVLIVRKVA